MMMKRCPPANPRTRPTMRKRSSPAHAAVDSSPQLRRRAAPIQSSPRGLSLRTCPRGRQRPRNNAVRAPSRHALVRSKGVRSRREASVVAARRPSSKQSKAKPKHSVKQKGSNLKEAPEGPNVGQVRRVRGGGRVVVRRRRGDEGPRRAGPAPRPAPRRRDGRRATPRRRATARRHGPAPRRRGGPAPAPDARRHGRHVDDGAGRQEHRPARAGQPHLAEQRAVRPLHDAVQQIYGTERRADGARRPQDIGLLADHARAPERAADHASRLRRVRRGPPRLDDGRPPLRRDDGAYFQPRRVLLVGRLQLERRPRERRVDEAAQLPDDLERLGLRGNDSSEVSRTSAVQFGRGSRRRPRGARSRRARAARRRARGRTRSPPRRRRGRPLVHLARRPTVRPLGGALMESGEAAGGPGQLSSS